MIDHIIHMPLSGLIADISLIIVGISTFVQISPIKLNPWSWLAKKFGRAINKEMMDRIDKLDGKVDGLECNVNRIVAKNNRAKIIRFASEIRLRQKHSKDYFDEVMASITEYNKYCDEHPEFENNITVASSQLIEETYRECLRENTFL